MNQNQNNETPQTSRNSENSPSQICFDRAFAKLRRLEGGYSDHQADSGGKTKYGITENVARQYGYDGEMKTLSIEMAKEIYFQIYWAPRKLSAVSTLSPLIAEKIFLAGVNVGPSRITRWLQTALNALNRQERDWKNLYVDGALGTETLKTLATALETPRMEKIILKALNSIQGNYYIELALMREKDQTFLRGWLLKRVKI